MRSAISSILVGSLVLFTACAKSTSAPAPVTAAAPRHGLQIKLSTVYVDDQDKALRFYTEVLGFAKKDDFSNSGYRWLTVSAPGDADGPQLQLAADNLPAGKAYQQALFQMHAPAAMFFTDDVKADAERIAGKGGKLTMPPTPVTGSIIAQVEDGCGNLVQLTQLVR